MSTLMNPSFAKRLYTKYRRIGSFPFVSRQRIVFTLAIFLLGSVLTLGATPLATAHAAPTDVGQNISRCAGALNVNYRYYPANYASNSIQVNGAGYTGWNSPYGILGGDVFFVTGFGSTRIDYWGTQKWASGDADLAPSGWPLPGAHKYALLVGPVGNGYVFDYTTGKIAYPGHWLEVGALSHCIVVNGTQISLVFSINDDNLGDNAGGPIATVYQYWS